MERNVIEKASPQLLTAERLSESNCEVAARIGSKPLCDLVAFVVCKSFRYVLHSQLICKTVARHGSAFHCFEDYHSANCLNEEYRPKFLDRSINTRELLCERACACVVRHFTHLLPAIIP